MYFHGPFTEDGGGEFLHDVGVYLSFISFLLRFLRDDISIPICEESFVLFYREKT